METIDLAGKVALITGAASGIGAACATRLARLGATVVGLDVDTAAGEALFEKLGAEHRYRYFDVTDPEGWDSVVAETIRDLGRLDIVHLNAGVMSRPRGAPILDSPLDWFTLDAYHKVRGVNLDGVVYGLIATIRQGSVAQIVLTASGAAVTPLPLDPYYTATKFALLGLGLALAPSLAERGIRIDVICPGAVDTAITAPDVKAAFKQETPDFIADSLVTVLASAGASNHAWLAYTETEGVVPYVTGALSALDLVEGTVT